MSVVAAVLLLGLATARAEWAKTDLVFCTLSQVPSVTIITIVL